MNHKIYSYIFSLFFLLFCGNAVYVSACSCLPFSVCGDYNTADAIFVGKIVGSTYESKREITISSQNDLAEKTSEKLQERKEVTITGGQVSFKIAEGFKNAVKDKSIVLHQNGGTCDVEFVKGETYLVFASKNTNGTFSTSICSATKLLSQADEDLEFLRNPPKIGSGAKLFGSVFENINDYTAENLSVKEMSNAKIKIQSTVNPKKVFYAVTDADGNYEINVPVGTYKITPVIDKGYDFTTYKEKDVFTAKDRFCENYTFTVTNKSEISGTVLDENGKPLKSIAVEMYRENAGQHTFANSDFAISDENGKFVFSGVSLGRYFLSINYDDAPNDELPYPTTYFPYAFEQTDAQIFEIGIGTKYTKLVFNMPPKLKKAKVSGIVTTSDGNPVKDAEIILVDEEFDHFDPFKEIKTDENGRFTVEGYVGRKYLIRAMTWKEVNETSRIGSGNAESDAFILEFDTPEKKLEMIFVDLPDFPVDKP